MMLINFIKSLYISKLKRGLRFLMKFDVTLVTLHSDNIKVILMRQENLSAIMN